MEIILTLIAASLIVALLRGGSIDALLATRFRLVALVFAAAAIQIYFVVWPPAWLDRGTATLLYLGSQAVVVTFLVLNRHLAGVLLIGLGLGLNMFSIAANGAMPVSETATRLAGAEYLTDHRHVEHGLHLRNEVMDDSTRMPFLGDVIPVPGLAQVMSLGDLVIAVGVVRLVLTRTKPDPRASLTNAQTSPSGAQT